MARGVTAAWPDAEVRLRPLSDGGNGLLEACARLTGGSFEEHVVAGPLGAPTSARLLRQGPGSVVESAEACGLHLVAPGDRDPLAATTRGVGELLEAARAGGATEITLGLGGSGTVDGGTGMARALGWRFLDASDGALPEGGGALPDLRRIEPPRSPFPARVVALCDVENPLTGPQGAARVYGPQKGAGAVEVERLEAGLVRLGETLEAGLGFPVAGLPGAGAAGGLGAGAAAFLGAELVSGADWLLQRAGLREELSVTDLLVTGEGRFDPQSGMGKVTGRALEAARTAGVPVLLVAGKVERSPAGVQVADGGGAVLDEADVARLTEAACRARAGGDRL
jgi:glycerate kinase